MGAYHGATLAWRLPGARLAAVADPAPGAAERLAAALGAGTAYTDSGQAFADPGVEAVVIAAPARFHADLIVAAAGAGKAVFCEKPAALNLADLDRAIDAVRTAGVPLQVGFNRRFAPDWAAARALLDDGTLGTPRLIRSVTRDPGGFDPSRVPPDTIFNETLIHDFDALRFLNPGAEAVEVYAIADALVEPDWRDRGLLDTAVVTVRFDNGAVGFAEACFEATYGYDVRGEVFGSGGWPRWVTGAAPAWCFPDRAVGRWTPCAATRSCWPARTPPSWLRSSTVFAAARRPRLVGRMPGPRWRLPWPQRSPSARAARCESRRWTSDRTGRHRQLLPACRLGRDGVRGPAVRGPGPADRRPRVRGRDLGLDAQGRRRAG
jgi:myo-inositol 2-dehydrogenase/D-chiro-inositol 1-dehydrogenase